MKRLKKWMAAGAVTLCACALSSNVAIAPLHLLPGDIVRPTSLKDAVDRGDYRQAADMAEAVEQKHRPRVEQLALLGRAQLFCGLYEEARDVLHRALESRMPPTLRAQIEWDLAQVAFQQRDLERALEYTLKARESGLNIRRWYTDYLTAVQGIRLHSIEGDRQAIVDFRFGSPDLPRFDAVLNDELTGEAVLDSGAAMSIVSRSFLERAGIRPLEGIHGLFYGLLGEPIQVTFAMIDSLRIGEMGIRNIPVAVMADHKLHFFVKKDERFNIDFLIGTSLLQEFRLRFDYSRNRLTLDYLEPAARVPVADQNLFLVDQKPLVHVAINQQGWYPFLLDTGSEVTFLNETKFSIQNVTFGVPRYHGATMQGLGGTQKTGMRVKNVSIGVDRWSGVFDDIPLYSDERPGATGILGQNFLKNFDVEIDFGRMRVEIHRPDVSRW